MSNHPSKTPYRNHDGHTFKLVSFDEARAEKDGFCWVLTMRKKPNGVPYYKANLAFKPKRSLSNKKVLYALREDQVLYNAPTLWYSDFVKN